MKSSPGFRPRITIITPVFNELDNLDRYEQEVRAKLLDSAEADFSIILVDDGSQDGSWKAIQAICRRDSRFQGLRLSRNYGSHVALCAGLHHAEGDAVATLACDLQDPPDVVLEFVRRWRQGARIVWGKRRTRSDSTWRVWSSRLFENLLRRYAMPSGSRFATGSFLLLDRKVLECYRAYKETNRITFALVAWTGFDEDVVEYDRCARLAGASKWKLHHMVRTSYDAFLSFSRVPFGFITAVGAGLFVLSILLGIYLLFNFLTGDPKPGWVSIMLALSTFFGLHFIFMSVQGEYLARIYSEAVGRPLYFVSDTTAEEKEQSRDAA